MARKVEIERVEGGDHPHIALGAVREWWEMIRPTVGEKYLLFTDCGRIFRSSRVIQVLEEAFKTRHSCYSLRVLETMD
jgi:hypothetical protein